MLFYDIHSAFAVILLEKFLILQFIVTNNSNFSKKILLSEIDELESKIKTNSLKQPFSCNFIKPVEFESEGHKIDEGKRVFNCPIFPSKPEKIKFEGKHFDGSCIVVDTIGIAL